MVRESTSEILIRVLGFEIVTLLMNRPMSRSEIKSLLPYEDVHDTQIERILDACYEENIITITPERGPDKFELDYSQFNQMELEIINIKALVRMNHPAEERGGSVAVEDIPEEFFVYKTRESLKDKTAKHVDYAHMESKFIGLDGDSVEEN